MLELVISGSLLSHTPQEEVYYPMMCYCWAPQCEATNIKEQQVVKAVTRNDYILMFGEVFETSATKTLPTYALPSFSHFIAHGWSSQFKHVPSNSNAHMAPVSSKVIEMQRGIHGEYIHVHLVTCWGVFRVITLGGWHFYCLPIENSGEALLCGIRLTACMHPSFIH